MIILSINSENYKLHTEDLLLGKASIMEEFMILHFPIFIISLITFLIGNNIQ